VPCLQHGNYWGRLHGAEASCCGDFVLSGHAEEILSFRTCCGDFVFQDMAWRFCFFRTWLGDFVLSGHAAEILCFLGHALKIQSLQVIAWPVVTGKSYLAVVIACITPFS
jgi:hypothetical protein